MDEILSLTLRDWVFIGSGALFLLGGWLLYWFSLNAAGALILGAAGFLAGNGLADYFELGDSSALILAGACGIVGAFVGAAIVRFLHKIFFFLAGCFVGAAVFYSLVSSLRGETSIEWLKSDMFFAFGVPGAGALMGILAVVFSDYLIVWATAFLGAALIMTGLDWPYGGLPGLAAAILGGIIQTALTRPFRKKAADG